MTRKTYKAAARGGAAALRAGPQIRQRAPVPFLIDGAAYEALVAAIRRRRRARP